MGKWIPGPGLDCTSQGEFLPEKKGNTTVLLDYISEYKEEKNQQFNNKKIKQKYANIWRLNNTFLNATWVKKEVTNWNISNDHNEKAPCQ